MSGGKPWTTGEVRKLCEMRAQGFKTWAIAQELGRTENSIFSFVAYKSAGKPKRTHAPTITEWSPAAVERLRELAEEGATATETAMELCRPLYAVKNKASREGISFGNKSKDAPFRLEREGYGFRRDAIEGSAKLKDAILAVRG